MVDWHEVDVKWKGKWRWQVQYGGHKGWYLPRHDKIDPRNTPSFLALLFLFPSSRIFINQGQPARKIGTMAIDTTHTAVHDVKMADEKAQIEDTANLDQNAKASEYKASAIEAENAEHNMGVLEAVKAYPMASLWAFVMSCTIVS
jgi:hypothetical protein